MSADSAPPRPLEPGAPTFPIVGIGASAGGLEALSQLLDALPVAPGLSLVIIQHLDPSQESHLAGLLQRAARLPVLAAADGLDVAVNCAYVIQPNTKVTITDGTLSVARPRDTQSPRDAVDTFLRSLARAKGAQAIGVVLSGNGSDGTLGLAEIKDAGGMTFAQDVATARFPGMPQSALAGGVVDFVLPPAEIGRQLGSIAQHPFLHAERPTPADGDGDTRFGDILSALHRETGVDFSQYRDSTIRRRLARRMVLRGIDGLDAYADLVMRDPDEVRALYGDVLINVTSFFRDPEMFAELERRIFPAIVQAKSAGDPIRVWVPGCSTGEEAYSLAISLFEYLDDVPADFPVQIFATDLSDTATLQRARAGRYPRNIETQLSPERLQRFFVSEEDAYRIQPAVREVCVFARQNLTADPPFSRVDLITCRNVLIYMTPVLQRRIMRVFHFALNTPGYLVLGSAESVGESADLFDEVSRAHRLYAKRATAVRPALAIARHPGPIGQNPPAGRVAERPAAEFRRAADRVLLGHYAPPAVLVNDHFDVMEFRGRTGPFLEAPSGQPTSNLLQMVRPGLFVDLRTALADAKAAGGPITRTGLRAPGEPDVPITLRIFPVALPGYAEPCYLVAFETGAEAPVASVPAASRAEPDGEVRQLRQELSATKDYLQSLVDQLEASNQDLRSAHEELLSSNEELQSTNEELETAKEELQSTNEELTTVNDQLHERNAELSALSTDLSNFVASANLPLVMVNADLHVRRLTPAAQPIFNLRPQDVGRPLQDISGNLKVEGLDKAIAGVMGSGEAWAREVTDRDGRWFMLRAEPYRTSEGSLEGAVIFAVDIDGVKRAQQLRDARDLAGEIVDAVQVPLMVLNGELEVERANRAFYAAFGGTPANTESRRLAELDDRTWNVPALVAAMGRVVKDGAPVKDVEIESDVPSAGRRTLLVNASALVPTARPLMVLVSIEDVTDRRASDKLRIDTEALRQLDRRKDEFLSTLAHELRNPLAPLKLALQLLSGSSTPDDRARAQGIAERQVGHLIRIVDDLLDAARVTQGKVELRAERVELRTIVNAAIEISQPLIDASGLNLLSSIPDEPVVLAADPIRLTQVLLNLLANAVKFTPRGGQIWLMAEIVEPTDAASALRIRVRDTGVGMRPELLPRIFDMFAQGDLSLERPHGGLGIGLTLARSLVLLHGGTIEASSAGPDLGSEFVVTLPLPAAEASPRADTRELAPREGATPRRILLADDDLDSREILTTLLGRAGHTVLAVADGADAIERAAAFQPDVVVLDLSMPGLNGYATARRLRAEPWGQTLYLIALSGLGQAQHKRDAQDAGFDLHLTKPVSLERLLEILAAVPGRDGTRA